MSLFNMWRKYPNRKPRKTEQTYLCFTSAGAVLALYYTYDKKWIDISRRSVFDGYKVYKPSRASIEDNRMWEDSLCERIDIIAWKKVPKKCRWFKAKGEDDE